MKTNSITFKILIVLTGGVMLGCGGNSAKNEDQQVVTNNEENVALGETEDLQEESDYLITAYMNNQLQLALGEVADRNALSPEVKELSSQILAENQTVQTNLRDLARAAEIDLNPALSPDFISLIDTIQSFEGRKFDSALVYTVIEEHENDIERLNEWATSTSNAIIRQEITENLDILQAQLAKAKEIQSGME